VVTEIKENHIYNINYNNISMGFRINTINSSEFDKEYYVDMCCVKIYFNDINTWKENSRKLNQWIDEEDLDYMTDVALKYKIKRALEC
jgi:hypothetical protein